MAAANAADLQLELDMSMDGVFFIRSEAAAVVLLCSRLALGSLA